MSNRVTTVVRCGDLIRHVYTTVESVAHQAAEPGAIVLVTDPSLPPPAREWVIAFAADRRLLTAHAPVSTPGAIRNAGARLATSPYVVCLDAGDLLDPSFCEVAARYLDDDPGTGLVTSGVLHLGPGSGRRVITPGACGLDEVLADAELVHGASMFRREAWDEYGGFDEALPTLDDWEFWIRLLAAGARLAVTERPLLIRSLRRDALYRRQWDRAARASAVARIVEEHASLFGRDPGAVLFAREHVLQDLGAEYKAAIARRDDVRDEMAVLDARARELGPAQGLLRPVDLGDLRRTTPVSRDWGYERGVPIDRHYIERFLERHAGDVRGTVLEIQEGDYTRRFGGDRVTHGDVLDVDPGNSRATVVADLRAMANVPSDTYDCIVLTQTLHVVSDMAAVVAECARILKPGGVLLATLPGASRVCLEYGHDGDFWRATADGARALLASSFPQDRLEVEAKGNVLVNAAFLYGLACHELTDAEFDTDDPYFPLIVTVRASKPAAGQDAAGVRRSPAGRAYGSSEPGTADGAVILLYHRVAALDSDIHQLAVPPQEFREQIAWLAGHCHVVPLEDLVTSIRAGAAAPPRAVALTFDDGYLDNYEEASSVLVEFGVPATFFVTTDRIDDLDSGYEFWWDALERTFFGPSSEALPALLHVELPDGPHDLATRTRAERVTAHRVIHESIVSASTEERDRVLAYLQAWSGSAAGADSRSRRMRAAEVADLARRPGHVVGAHSRRHLMLPRQPAAVQREEIRHSRQMLEAVTGSRVSAFAYPFGAYGDDTVAHVREAGFELALTCIEAPLRPGADPLRLPRLEVTRRGRAPFPDWVSLHLSSTPA